MNLDKSPRPKDDNGAPRVNGLCPTCYELRGLVKDLIAGSLESGFRLVMPRNLYCAGCGDRYEVPCWRPLDESL